ncbi:MAG TPA: class I SAM-dependent methyltransferase [Anaeromyxobacteraceae bacterium]
MRLAVTTSRHPAASGEAAARAAAARHGVPFLERRGRALAALAASGQAEALLVLSPARAALWVDGGEHAWAAGMGELRAKRLAAGERSTRDGFLEAAGLQAGDSVLDATLGLGMDALVAAVAVGPGGRILGLEASQALAALTAEGLARDPDPAARRIEVRRADAAALLAELAPRSFDVVVFDPMFRTTRAGAAGFDLVRRLGDARPLAPETLARARAVARRWVVVKDGTPGWDLARLGLTPLPCARWAKRLYGRAPAR